MGFIGKIIKHFVEDEIREVVTEIYDTYNKSSILSLPAGIDSCPILGDESKENNDTADKSIIVEIDSAGHSAIIGVLPPAEVLEGEIKIFGRDPLTGEIKSYILCKTDGSIDIIHSDKSKQLFNLDGSIEISTSTDKLIIIKNSAENLKQLFDDLIKEIKAIKTFGSPTNHTIDPSTQALFDTLQTRIDSLFGA